MGIQVKYTCPEYVNKHGDTEPEVIAYLARHVISDVATYIVEPYTFNTRQEAEAALFDYHSRDCWNSPTLEQILERTKRVWGHTIEFIEV